MIKHFFSGTARPGRTAMPVARADAGTAAAMAPSSMERLSSMRFDWAMTALFCVFLGGVYLDGWAHNHKDVEDFFTPYHLVLYSGFAAVSALTIAAMARGHARGFSWRESPPAGYELSVVGILIFSLGGAVDSIWHTLWGVETGIEPLLSPPHLLLMFGGVLIAPGPLRAYSRRVAAGVQPPGWLAQLPALLSWTFLLSGFTFITNYLSNFGVTGAAANFARNSGTPALDPALGIATCMIQAALIMGVALVMLKSWHWLPPTASLTIMLTINIGLMALMKTHLVTTGRIPIILVGLAGGLAGDVLLRLIQPSNTRVYRLRAFGFTFPAALFLFYFIAIAIWGDGIAWSGPAWTGTIVLTGAIGMLLSYVLVPPVPAPVTTRETPGAV